MASRARYAAIIKNLDSGDISLVRGGRKGRFQRVVDATRQLKKIAPTLEENCIGIIYDTEQANWIEVMRYQLS